jgi:hypothetical protein
MGEWSLANSAFSTGFHILSSAVSLATQAFYQGLEHGGVQVF